VLDRVDQLTLEGRMFQPHGINLATKAIVLGLNIFICAFAHVPIVARCGRIGANTTVEVRLYWVGPGSADVD
jgi:hypothetical protein